MESLERLASSIAQVELLVASLKRENRDLAARLALAASERLEFREDAESRLSALRQTSEARIEELTQDLETIRSLPRQDPEMEGRALTAEQAASELALELNAVRNSHRENQARLEDLGRQQAEAESLASAHESLIRQLQAQIQEAAQSLEQRPAVNPEELAEARNRENQALAAQREAQDRAQALAAHLRDLQARLDTLLATEIRVSDEAEELKERLAGQSRRLADLEREIEEKERLLNEAREKLSDAVKLEGEQSDLKRQRREASAFAKERHALRRKVEELLATLESVRLG